jgi:siderophore synthetase component
MPELADRFARQDLFVPRFDRSCLNRLQLRDTRQMVDLDDPDPASGLQLAGTLENPLVQRV